MPEPPPPAPPRDAAVVVLVRPSASGREVFWLRRETTLSFAAGFYAFPGGRVDAADVEVGVVGAEGEDARLRAAAARELFEEAGILRARGETPAPAVLRKARAALLDGTRSFSNILSELGLRLHAEDFLSAGRWVTPAWMPVRFDARFFLVQVPPETAAEVWPGELAEGAFPAGRADKIGDDEERRAALDRALRGEQQLAQVGPLDVAHRQVHPAVGLAEVEDPDDVGMAQPRGDRRLAQEAPPEAIVVRQFVGKHLQRDPRARLLLLGQVDDATGAAADELDDAVTREDRTDGQLPAHGMSLAHVQVSRPRPLASPGLQPSGRRPRSRPGWQ